MDIVKQFAPEVLPVLQQLGGALFQGLNQTQTADAGALILSTDMVRTIQTQLVMLQITDDSGAVLAPDGSYGLKTKQAVMKFQKANNLTADGWAGALTQAALSAAVAKLPK
jgi:peptidoglycan hydrolase-like protein with peptidoglycan-binding domain